MKKTNAIRLLEQAGIDYEARMYPVDESDLSGTHAAEVLGLPAGQVFKTLVLRGAKTGYFVCCIPVDQEVDLKRQRRRLGIKGGDAPHEGFAACDGLSARRLLAGGHEEKVPDLFRRFCTKWERISVSAGTRGEMVLVGPERLRALTGAMYAELVL